MRLLNQRLIMMLPRKDQGMIHAGSLAIRTLRVTTVQGEVVVSQQRVSQFFGSHQMQGEESFYGHFH